jgi:hypothetical protein
VRFSTIPLWCAALTGSFACGSSNSLDRVDDARLVAADADSADWLTYGRTYSEHQHAYKIDRNEQRHATEFFVRFRPIAAEGTLEGRNPFADILNRGVGAVGATPAATR